MTHTPESVSAKLADENRYPDTCVRFLKLLCEAYLENDGGMLDKDARFLTSVTEWALTQGRSITPKQEAAVLRILRGNWYLKEIARLLNEKEAAQHALVSKQATMFHAEAGAW